MAIESTIPQPTVVVEPQSWWTSKTLWLNVAAMAVETVQMLGQLNIVPPGAVAIAAGVLNIITRKFTTQPIGTAQAVPVSPISLQGLRVQMAMSRPTERTAK